MCDMLLNRKICTCNICAKNNPYLIYTVENIYQLRALEKLIDEAQDETTNNVDEL